MILSTMNIEELTKEVLSDYLILERKAQYYTEDCMK